jgi:hypothetical protein
VVGLWLPYLKERSMALYECAGVEVNLNPARRTRSGRMSTVLLSITADRFSKKKNKRTPWDILILENYSLFI